MPIVKVTKNTYTVEPLYQWDLNQQLVIYGLSLASVPEIHFANAAMDRAIVRQASMDAAGVVRVDVPNSLLQKPYTIKAYVCTYAGATFETQYKLEIPVKARNKPADYTLEDDPEVYSFNALENQVLNLLDEVTAATNTANEAKTAAAGKLASFNGRTDAAAMPKAGDYTAAMVGAAPAGYGLGSKGELILTTDDLDNVWKCGFYVWGYAPVNAPLDATRNAGLANCAMLVYSRDSKAIVQRVTCFAGGNIYNNCTAQRVKNANDVSEWEWENPPMQLGVKYRTTERYNGKPVYCVLFNFGALPSGGADANKEHNIANIEYAISVDFAGYKNPGGNLQPNVWVTDDRVLRMWFDATNVGVRASADANLSGQYVVAYLKYTKTTD